MKGLRMLTESSLFHPLLLLVWLAIGTGLRFTNLTLKPLWTDEFSTIVFSLGHGFRSVPLDQAIALNTLLEPLQLYPQTNVGVVVERLLEESNHPPLYFILTHLWLRLFSSQEGFVSVGAVRSLPAWLGVASIPASFGLGWLVFRSRLVGQLAAALMAVSPFAIYLAQEARHYTLPILWVIASLCCFSVAIRETYSHRPLPIPVGLAWVVVNGLGIATHYFFSITLGAEALVLTGFGLIQSWMEKGVWHRSHWWRIWVVAAGTAVSGVVWLPFMHNLGGDELTRWIYSGDRSGLALLDPVLQALVGWITMLFMLPIQASGQTVVIVSGAIMILVFLWTVPVVIQGLKVQWLHPRRQLAVQVLGGFVLSAIALFFFLTYGFSMNLTSAFRYNFVYFPAVIVLVAASLASCWRAATLIANSSPTSVKPALLSLLRNGGKKAVVLIWLMGLLGGLTVACNLGYQKTHRPDVVAQAIQQTSQGNVLIAIAHRTHGQTGRLMGVAWELRRRAADSNLLSPQFLLAHQERNPGESAIALQQTLSQLPRPLDLWLINFQSETPELAPVLESQNCIADPPDPQARSSVDGYRYQRYQCRES